ncbi:MAG: HEAT repeat domain-containing protein, partial [Chloroflexota bacterium]|nr:HEAT repeat domain-containing protein [Chloroflexota bacterium]
KRSYDYAEELANLGPLDFDPLAIYLNVEKEGNDFPLESVDIEKLSLDAIEGLGILGDPRAVPILSRLYDDNDEDKRKRYRSAEALKEIGNDEAIEALESKLFKNLDYSWPAEYTLEKMGAKATRHTRFSLNPNSIGCPYLRQNACHFRQLSSKKQSDGPDKCSLQVRGYQNCHVWAIEPK